MPKKKKLSKEERKRIRLQKGKQWLITYQGTPKHMNKHYRERFHVDAVTAAHDLMELGVNYTQEQLDQIKRAEEQRLEQKRAEKAAKEQKKQQELYADCDDRFAFIVGYTSGGAPYGLQWEEVSIDPKLPFEEKVQRYVSGDYEMPTFDALEEDEDRFQVEVLPYDFTICKVVDYSGVNPDDEFCFLGRTDTEKSLVCITDRTPANTTERSDGWKAFRISGSLDFSIVGLLADISGILAERDISIFAVSTFDTDYILVKKNSLKAAENALLRSGYDVIELQSNNATTQAH